jgi:hypothetical protein
MKKKTRRTRDTTEQRLQRWVQRHYTLDRVAEAQALPLRRDVVTLLTYVRDHKITGTKTTGNMPLKAIREVTAQFVEPPQLDYTYGEYTRKLRTEYDIWALHFLHIIAGVGGLLVTEPGRRWTFTPHAAKFLEADPVFQLSLLLSVWWFEVNWLVAFPFVGMGDYLPDSFTQTTLARLRGLRVGAEVPFDEFADTLIEKTGLTWSQPDSAYAQDTLRSSIRRMVINVLERFGSVRCTFRDNPIVPSIKDLDTVEITPLGAALLDSLLVGDNAQ